MSKPPNSRVIKNNDGVAVVEGSPQAKLMKDSKTLFSRPIPPRKAGETIRARRTEGQRPLARGFMTRPSVRFAPGEGRGAAPPGFTFGPMDELIPIDSEFGRQLTGGSPSQGRDIIDMNNITDKDGNVIANPTRLQVKDFLDRTRGRSLPKGSGRGRPTRTIGRRRGKMTDEEIEITNRMRMSRGAPAETSDMAMAAKEDENVEKAKETAMSKAEASAAKAVVLADALATVASETNVDNVVDETAPMVGTESVPEDTAPVADTERREESVNKSKEFKRKRFLERSASEQRATKGRFISTIN